LALIPVFVPNASATSDDGMMKILF